MNRKHTMFFFEVIFLSFMTFLLDFHVSGCDKNCTDRPAFTPSHLVVKYGDPASVMCNVCQQVCYENQTNLERSVGVMEKNGTTISWRTDSLTEWGLSLQCYYTTESDDQCCTILPFTLYRPPDKVSISFGNHTGPLKEAHSYTLQCTVHNVAPVGKVLALFYKGDSIFKQLRVPDDDITTMTKSYAVDIVPTQSEDGAEYWCAAQLYLGSEGPQPPPVVISQKMITTVYYAPVLQVPTNRGVITITEGDQLKLDCSSVGNPMPSYNWTLPSGSLHPSQSSILSIASVSAEHEGTYTCTVSNIYWNFTEEFYVEVRANYIVYIVVGILLAVVLLVIIGFTVWTRYYRQKRMGRYNLRDVFRFRSGLSAVPTGE